MAGRIGSLILKDTIQFSRDKTILAVVFWMYTLEVLICGYGMTFEVRDLPVAVVDNDRSPASRDLIDRFELSEAFEIVGYPPDPATAEHWMRRGKAQYGLVIPVNFGRDLEHGRAPELQVLLDGTNSNAASLAKDYTAEIVNRFQRERAAAEPGGEIVRPAVQIWYNRAQTLESFVVLSMILAAVLMVGTIHSAATITREKEVGTIDQLMVTPTRIWEMFLAKTVPTLAVGILGFFPSLFIIWWFGVPIHGSLLLFLALTAVFLFSAIAIGVLIASITKTLQQALLLCFFGLFPIMFLSGTMTPIDSMPAAIQPWTQISPLRHYMEIAMGIFLKGVGFAELWPAALKMAVIGAVLYLIAAMRFRQNIKAG
ncbi:MAG: ABC transporter permease [Pseudomonadales bacterium]|nr:ABC transporter permease [Pseudomonadales bacterium]